MVCNSLSVKWNEPKINQKPVFTQRWYNMNGSIKREFYTISPFQRSKQFKQLLLPVKPNVNNNQ